MRDKQKRDLYNSESKWNSWRKSVGKRIPEIRKEDSDLILEFLDDMAKGKNVSRKSPKGDRSYIRLNTLRSRLLFFARNFKKPFTKLTKDDVHDLFSGMRKGKVKRNDGKEFISTGTYVKDYKSFHHWLERKEYVSKDITEDLSRKDEKSNWVYLTREEFKLLADSCNVQYRALIWFMYDALTRVSDAFSIKVRDLDLESVAPTVVIHEDTTKGQKSGRTNKLKLSVSLLKHFIKINNLQRDDYLFSRYENGKIIPLNRATMTQYLKRLSKSLFGTGVTKGREAYENFTLYDIRHNSACFWLQRYGTISQVMRRGGWKKEEQVRYYSEFLGWEDDITDDDMVSGEDRNNFTKLESHIQNQKEIIEELIERLEKLESEKKVHHGLMDLLRIAENIESMPQGTKTFKFPDMDEHIRNKVLEVLKDINPEDVAGIKYWNKRKKTNEEDQITKERIEYVKKFIKNTEKPLKTV